MTDAARYVKVVEWSEEDGAFIGQCPGIIGPCCHGDDEVDVYRELCAIDAVSAAAPLNSAVPDDRTHNAD